MANIKLSQIVPAPNAPGPTDTVVGVLGGNTDAQITITQLASSVNSSINTSIFNIVNFGAVADGLTNNTTAIQNAINAAEAVGGEVIIPSTVRPFAFNGTLNITSGCKIRGLGVALPAGFSPCGPALKWVGSGATDIFVVSNAFHAAFENFTLDCPNLPSGGNAFNCSTTPNIEFVGMFINNCFNGIKIANGYFLYLRRMQINPQARAAYGLYVTEPTLAGVTDMEHVYVFPSTTPSSTLTGIQFGVAAGSLDARFCAGNACNIGWRFFTEDGTSNNMPGIIDLINCVGENNTSYGFWFQQCFDINVIDPYANINRLFGILVDGQCAGLNIIGGQVLANNQHGVYLRDGCREVHLNCVNVADNSQGSPNNYSGINVDPGAQFFSVVNCRLGGVAQFLGGVASGAQRWGIAVNVGTGVHGPCDWYTISLNNASGNVTAGVVDSGSGTNKIVNNNL